MMEYRSSQGEIYKQLRTMLTRDGVLIGGGAGYPRVELHSFTELPAQDKDGGLREMTAVVESISASSYGEAVEMNSENLTRIAWREPETEHFRVIGIVPDTLTEMTEQADTQTVLYRQLQTIRIILTVN